MILVTENFAYEIRNNRVVEKIFPEKINNFI